MTAPIDAMTLKTGLSDGDEIALLDVSEHGRHGAGDPFFAVPLPYSARGGPLNPLAARIGLASFFSKPGAAQGLGERSVFRFLGPRGGRDARAAARQ